MSILKTCCCCLSIRKGSFSVGLFTLIYYTIVVAIGAFHVHEGTHSSGLLALSFLIVLMSGLCVAASVFLLVGLSVECKQMLLPWIVIITATNLFDILYTILWLFETYQKSMKQIEKEESHTFIVLIIDIIMCAFNFYGIVCIVSQYQLYEQDNGTVTYRSSDKNLLPPIEFRLIPVHNSKQNPRDIEPKRMNNHIIDGHDCLKVPKLCDSSSGSSAVEEISDGSLLTTIDETKIDFRNNYSETRFDNKESIANKDSNILLNNNSINNNCKYSTHTSNNIMNKV